MDDPTADLQLHPAGVVQQWPASPSAKRIFWPRRRGCWVVNRTSRLPDFERFAKTPTREIRLPFTHW
jgi:hypothetical protein